MEFLRFGSSIPGSYWGCCAVDIIQNFKVDPDDKASIEIVDGDGGMPCGDRYAGKTWGEIFRQRLRYGTFGISDMPNHAFFAILTEWQIRDTKGIGGKWLKILKEEGFEFVRAVSNSVYTGPGTNPSQGSAKPNYIFALYRNIGNGAMKDPFTPPKQWTDLDKVIDEPWEKLSDTAELTKSQQKKHKELYDALPKGVFYTKAQLEAEGIPVWRAGRRSPKPQELDSVRKSKEEQEKKAAAPTPFAKSVA